MEVERVEVEGVGLDGGKNGKSLLTDPTHTQITNDLGESDHSIFTVKQPANKLKFYRTNVINYNLIGTNGADVFKKRQFVYTESNVERVK